ncbi:MAG: hypothetical protein IPK19_26195 [Chloroflexi bacterium]|nr:hypothetical protein [Chloroflexota bacterium]
MNFNGSGGVWRAEGDRQAGGWCADTLTEDLDLSYRAQLAGWRLTYLPDLVVPGEIPPRLSLYRQHGRVGRRAARRCLPRWSARSGRTRT